MELVQAMVSDHGLPVRQACRVARLARSGYYYARQHKDDSHVVTAIEAYIGINPKRGFDKLYATLREQDRLPCGKSRLYRVYRQMKLNVPRRGKRRLPERVREPLTVAHEPNSTPACRPSAWLKRSMSSSRFVASRGACGSITAQS